MLVAAVDIETTGLVPQRHNVIQLGIVCGDIHKPKKVQRYKVDIWPEDYIWSTYCINLHKAWLDRVAHFETQMQKKVMKFEDGPYVDRLDVATKVAAWFKEHWPDEKKFVAAGKNFGSFDLQFLKNLPADKPWQPGQKTVADLFKIRSLDPTLMYLQPRDAVPPELTICKERAITAGSKEITHSKVSHDALDDAEDVWNLLHFKAYETGT